MTLSHARPSAAAFQTFYDITQGANALLGRTQTIADDIAAGRAIPVYALDEAGKIIAASMGYLHLDGTYEIGSVLVAETGRGLYTAMRAAHIKLAGDRPIILFEKPSKHEIKKRLAEGFTIMKPWDPLFVMNTARKATQGVAPTPNRARIGFKIVAPRGTDLALMKGNDINGLPAAYRLQPAADTGGAGHRHP